MRMVPFRSSSGRTRLRFTNSAGRIRMASGEIDELRILCGGSPFPFCAKPASDMSIAADVSLDAAPDKFVFEAVVIFAGGFFSERLNGITRFYGVISADQRFSTSR